MKWKELVRDYLTFSRKERIGLLVTLAVIIGVWLFPRLAAPVKSQPDSFDSSWIVAAKKLQTREENRDGDSETKDEGLNEMLFDKSSNDYSDKPKGELFYFDPNSLTVDGWKKLGIREKTITTIQKYVSKGGQFLKPDDLLKIYGIRSYEFARLKPYIRIETTNIKKDFIEKARDNFKKEIFSNKNPKYNLVEINSSDTSAFIALPGIGSKLAARIITFRDKLGGFYSTDQIAETYGLPDSTFQKIKPFLKLDNASLKKININTATKDELKSHPYLRWTLANAIVEYRNQHGNYATPEDLKKISMVTEEIFAKIKPYVITE
jgi:competence ComEA-like helix-hairpin-helix protein